MQTEFTPLLSLLGGGLIGASAVLLMATHGRIAGISGILSRMLPPAGRDQSLPQGLIFLIGLLLAAPIWIVINGQAPLQSVSKAAGYLKRFAAGLDRHQRSSPAAKRFK